MAEKSTYLTLEKQSEGFYKEKGSKFIAYAAPCYSEDEVKELLQKWRGQHPQARHLCYAYRLGVDMKKFRANDDGEPNNSAGAPILGQIKSYELTNVLIGVIRYFGGTKLGVGGLISAYKISAKDAIDAGKIVRLEEFEWVKVKFGYPDMAEVMNLLKRNNLEMLNHNFEVDCELTIKLSLEVNEQVKSELEQFDSVELISKGIY